MNSTHSIKNKKEGMDLNEPNLPLIIYKAMSKNKEEVQKEDEIYFQSRLSECMPSLEEVRNAIDELAKKSTAPDAETPDWLRADIERGVNWALNYVVKKSKN